MVGARVGIGGFGDGETYDWSRAAEMSDAHAIIYVAMDYLLPLSMPPIPPDKIQQSPGVTGQFPAPWDIISEMLNGE
jgi:hypothetical protein